jgi:hypothetical protein
MIHDIGLRKDSGNSDIDAIFVVYRATLSVTLYATCGRSLLIGFGQVLGRRIYGY